MRLDQITSFVSLTVGLTSLQGRIQSSEVTTIIPMLSEGGFQLQVAGKLWTVTVDKVDIPALNEVISSGCAYVGTLTPLDQTAAAQNPLNTQSPLNAQNSQGDHANFAIEGALSATPFAARYKLQLQVFQHQPYLVNLQIRIAPNFLSNLGYDTSASASASCKQLKQDFAYTEASSEQKLPDFQDLKVPQLSELWASLPTSDDNWDTPERRMNQSSLESLRASETPQSRTQAQPQDEDEDASDILDLSLGKSWQSPHSFIPPASLWVLAFAQSNVLGPTRFERHVDESSNLAYQQQLTRKMREPTAKNAPFRDDLPWRYVSLHINDPLLSKLKRNLNAEYPQYAAQNKAWQTEDCIWDKPKVKAWDNSWDQPWTMPENAPSTPPQTYANSHANANLGSYTCLNIHLRADQSFAPTEQSTGQSPDQSFIRNDGSNAGSMETLESWLELAPMKVPGLDEIWNLGAGGHPLVDKSQLEYRDLPEECCLVGANAILTLRRTGTDSSCQVYDVVKVSRNANARLMLSALKPEQVLHLCQGHIEFVDGPQIQYAPLNLPTLAQGQGYLKLWYEYLTLAWEQLIVQARKVGIMYTQPVTAEQLQSKLRKSNTVLLSVPYGVPKTLPVNSSVRLFTEQNIPDFLLNPKIKAAELLKQAKVSPSGRLEFSTLNSGLICKVVNVYLKALEVVPLTRPDSFNAISRQRPGPASNASQAYNPENADHAGFVSKSSRQTEPYVAAALDVTGDLLQLNRSLNAYTHIINQTSAHPQLGAILEGRRAWLAPSVPHVPAFNTPGFKNLNASQQAAIDLALNTPDIALIQGPPGTGKTTVICAIVERLNELMGHRQHGGAILISGYQHDTVNNVVSKLSVNGLPTLKFGNAPNTIAAHARMDADLDERRVFDWIEQHSHKLLEQPTLKIITACEKLQTLKQHYAAHPTVSQALELIRLLQDVTPLIDRGLYQGIAQGLSQGATAKHAVNSERDAAQAYLQNQSQVPVQKQAQASAHAQREDVLNELKQRYEPMHQPLEPEVLRLIYAMRTDAQSYQDDGTANHVALLQALQGQAMVSLNASEQELLRTTSPQTEDFFKLRALQNRLLRQFKPRYRFNIVDYRLLELAEQDLACLQQQLAANQAADNQIGQVLFDFNEELTGNTPEVVRALTDYGLAYAATVQQAEGSSMRSTKVQKFAQWHKLNKAATGFKVLTLNLKDSLRQDGPILDEALSFDTVIIDEAARCSPLDLLIPLARAKKRIILVGDQNQLPHIVDEKISNILEQAQSQNLDAAIPAANGQLKAAQQPQQAMQYDPNFTRGNAAHATTANHDAGALRDKDSELNVKGLLQQSMFEHLRKVLQCQTDLDKKLRFITLNTQYRMHPELGEFVSQNFYAGQLKSVLAASHFSHNLPGLQNAFALWCHVPHSKAASVLGQTPAPAQVPANAQTQEPNGIGSSASATEHIATKHSATKHTEQWKLAHLEGRKNTSRYRLAEAQVIAAYVKAWLPELKRSGMNLGVITFYQAQVEFIKRELTQAGVNLDHEKLISINTTDAYQGKEFDFVILSMVRSHDLPQRSNLMASLDADNSLTTSQAPAQAAYQAQANPNTKAQTNSQIKVQAPHKSKRQVKNANQELNEAARYFGHLISAQRLCVALSRQKRCLMVVGNAEMVTHPLGQKYVPALYHFWQMCKEHHGVLTEE